jgi:hypothetical protein
VAEERELAQALVQALALVQERAPVLVRVAAAERGRARVPAQERDSVLGLGLVLVRAPAQERDSVLVLVRAPAVAGGRALARVASRQFSRLVTSRPPAEGAIQVPEARGRGVLGLGRACSSQ